MKLCKECNNTVFGGGYCKYHQYKRKMLGGDLYERKPPKKRKAIPKESKKRKEEGKTYKQIKDELRTEMIANGTYNCFFCGKPMGDEKGFHHTKGRDGSYLTDRKYLKPAHNQCHVWDYHQADIETLMQKEWYSDFLNRLKELDINLYNKEIKKQDKSELDL